MTTKDKTGDQLMASIRKTKTEGTAPEAKAAATPAAAASVPKKKVVAKAKPRTVRKKTTARSGAAQSRPAPSGGSYQSSKRVWPD